MKKLTILIILTITLAMIVPFASAAAAPLDNQPVSWVSWKGNMTPKIYEAYYPGEGHIWGNLIVKILSDGTIVGHIEAKNLLTHTSSYCTEITFVNITDNTAVIEGWFHDPSWSDYPIKERYTLVDNGEPAVGVDRINIELFIDMNGGFSMFGSPVPVPIVTHQNIQVHNGGESN